MARVIRITLMALAAIVAASIVALALLLWTPPGRAALRPLIAAALGGNVSIGELHGGLPAHLIVENVAFEDEAGEVWLVIDRAEIRWRPAALLTRRTDVDLVRIDGGELLKRPPKGAQKDRPRGLQLPDRLPRIRVADISVDDFRVAEPLVDRPLTVNGSGAVTTGPKVLDVRLNAASSGGRDRVSILLEREGDSLDADATIVAAADGALAAIADLSGPARVTIEGDGPLSDYRLNLASRLGAYGSLAGVLSGDLEKMERIDFTARAAFDERLGGLARIVGETASARGALFPRDDGGAIEIATWRSEIGVLSGEAEWRNRGGALGDATVMASADFADDWRPDLQRWIGPSAEVTAAIRPQGGRYAGAMSIKGPLLDAAIAKATTDLQSFVRGAATARLAASDGLPTGFKAGARAEADVDVVFDEGISSSNLILTTPQGGVFRGAASYQFDSESLAVKGEASAPPSLLAALNENLAATKNATAAIDIKGTTDDFGGTVVATTPPLTLNGRPLPAARSGLSFSDFPSAPAGKVSARASDGSRRLDAAFARGDGFWRVSGLDYAGRDFALKGSASLNPETNEGTVDLSYRGGAAAEPWPGIVVAGDLSARGALSRGRGTNRLTFLADRVATDRVAVTNLDAIAEGPAERLVVKATADSVATKGAAPIADVVTVMIADLRGDPEIIVSSFTAEIGGAPVALAAPATISFADGIAIDNLGATVGDAGSVAFTGAFSDSRWRGELSVKGAPLLSAASAVDLDLVLDTNKEVPASGTFALTSLLTRTDAARLAGRLRWDGRRLYLEDESDGAAIDFEIALPVRLVRAPAVTIETGGPLSGRARYSGRAETVAAFLPSALQSIEGALSFEGTAAGTLADPKLSGSLRLADGAYTELSSGLSIVNIDGTATASGARAGSEVRFNATGAGPGQTEKTITATGDATFGENARVAATLSFNKARLSAGPVDEASVTGEIALTGPFSDLLAKGAIEVANLDARVITPESTGLVPINVVAVNREGEPVAEGGATRPPTTLSYDIEVTGDDRLFIRGRGLTSEWRADLHLVGRANAPVVLGDMEVKRGEIVFSGRRFEVTKGTLAFDRLSPNNPAIDIRAERDTGEVVAVILMTGRARAPKVTLESTPPLPREDIMALVLFDKPASELSALESLQVAEGLASLGGIGPFGGEGLTGSARRALGLDVLSLDLDEGDSAATALTVGKYVAEGLFVSATQDARGQRGSVRIEYEIDDSFTVETELRQDGDQTVSANWKHDF